MDWVCIEQIQFPLPCQVLTQFDIISFNITSSIVLHFSVFAVLFKAFSRYMYIVICQFLKKNISSAV